MTDKKIISMDELMAQLDGDSRFSNWFDVDQSRIDKFADVTEDWQFIHIDPERAARETPFGGTIAHGFLSLSMLSAMAISCESGLEGTAMVINYGFNRIRFTSPVKVGARVRAKFTTVKVDEKSPTNILITKHVEIEIDGEKRPALTAEWLGLTILEKKEAT